MTSEEKKRSIKDTLVRYGFFLIGLFIASLGVAFSTIAGLGTSPVASVPYAVSLVSGVLTFGGWLNLWSLIQILITVAVLRRRAKPAEIAVQTLLAFLYGYLTDFSCFLLRGIAPGSYFSRFALMLTGCAVLAFGIWIQCKAGVAMLPGEAMNRAISEVYQKKYENVKIFFDVLYIVFSVSLCLIFFGRLEGVREGSVVAALLIGNLIKLYHLLYEKLSAAVRCSR